MEATRAYAHHGLADMTDPGPRASEDHAFSSGTARGERAGGARPGRAAAMDLADDARPRARSHHSPRTVLLLEVLLLSVLSPDELAVPSFSVPRTTACSDADHGAEEGVSVCGEGTLLVRFALGAGQPPQIVRVVARFRSADGRVMTADLAGYPGLRLRPFDATRDALTALPQVDLRLLALHEKVREFTDDEPTLQAFGHSSWQPSVPWLPSSPMTSSSGADSMCPRPASTTRSTGV